MRWIVQENLHNEKGYAELINSLERLTVPYTSVKVIPFSHEMIPDIQNNEQLFPYGTTTLAKEAKARRWTPGTFINDNFTFEQFQKNYGVNILNDDAVVCEFKDAVIHDRAFIRPVNDDKTFAGMVISKDDFEKWQICVNNLEESTFTTLRPTDKVVVASVKEIYQEFRFFVVDGLVVSGSQYKLGDRIVHERITDDLDIMWIYTQMVVSIWCPARAFCIDIAITPKGRRVIEINCINSAGLYAIDPQKFIEAIESMRF